MNYLMYYIDGFIKKFPLDADALTIGRQNDNDLVLREDFISRNHVRITNYGEHILVKDLGSLNGISYNNEKVKEALVKIGESFILGKMEFFLKKGSLDEFKLAAELIPIFDTIGTENEQKFDNICTRYIEDIYTETLKVVMQVGLKKNDLKEFMLDLGNHLSNLVDYGSLFIIANQPETFDLLLSVQHEAHELSLLKKWVKELPHLYKQPILAHPVNVPKNPGTLLYSYPLKSDDGERTLIFILNRMKKKEITKFEDFLTRLVIELDLLSQLLTGKRKSGEEKAVEPESEGNDIVAENGRMKEIIKQARKIAAGDIFVLVRGESGTGKELFARLIHKYSSRAKKQFVAINCAAIPENLLESELFGHEKGAFTGAYAQKKGKLEIASGGTLVLDEIGDMPMNLQSKLLRALQEKELYRLGATQPIKVDLRVISLTNRDLKQLIDEGEFREDLYYRLVHRTIVIPPLRERKEDIPALINFFTFKFCKLSGKKINGYSVKAFETLQAYSWRGNVRQLENEIRSIVDLTDDRETVTYDILSDEVKDGARIEAEERDTPKKEEDAAAQEMLTFAVKPTPEEEKEHVIKALKQNAWNKSQTARMLNITYRGLLKKLKRLGIENPD